MIIMLSKKKFPNVHKFSLLLNSKQIKVLFFQARIVDTFIQPNNLLKKYCSNLPILLFNLMITVLHFKFNLLSIYYLFLNKYYQNR